MKTPRPSCGVCMLVALLATTTASAAPPVRTMYNDALAREQKVRAALTAPDASASVLEDVRAQIAAYEAIVKRYPASGYSDNALWQAGCLALDAFAKFGQTVDRDAGIKLLRRLTAGYPASSLVAQVPQQLARVNVEAADRAGGSRQSAGRTQSAVGSRPTDVATQSAVGSRSTIATIRDIRRTVLTDAVRITIELDGEVSFHDERIADPPRVFVDLPATRAAPAFVDRTLRFEAGADVVRQVRVGRHPNNTTRVVLDAVGLTSYSVYPLYNPFRLVIDCVRTPALDAATMPAPHLPVEASVRVSDPPPIPPRTLTANWTRRVPSGSPAGAALLASARTLVAVEPRGAAPEAPAPPPPPLPSTPVAPPAAKTTAGGLTIARQLGLGVSRIVIDPGHGGHDPGAKGKGLTEAELVLDVAMRVEKLLEKVPGVEVILTRRTDDFIPLPERTAIANREGADLFLSIHANASPNPQARGIESYFLNFAINTSAAAVAARENATSTLAMNEMPDIVKAIALNNKVDESRDFARDVQRAMYERLRPTNKTLKDLGVKQAPFVVLIGATMPSVLAEISFVTNPQEGRLLKGNAYRQRIAESLFNAIRKYQTSLKAAPVAAVQ